MGRGLGGGISDTVHRGLGLSPCVCINVSSLVFVITIRELRGERFTLVSQFLNLV